jgi:hypothetical protein
MARRGPRGLPGGGPRGGPSQGVVSEGSRPNFLLGASPGEIDQLGVSSSNFLPGSCPAVLSTLGSLAQVVTVDAPQQISAVRAPADCRGEHTPRRGAARVHSRSLGLELQPRDRPTGSSQKRERKCS